MAILEEYQSAGFGKLLIEEIFNFIKINQNLLVFFSKKFIFAQTKQITDVLDIRISILFK